jgi:hypothetical protein
MAYNGAYWLELDSVKHAFSPANRPPVKGGRWFVRRWEDIRTEKDGKVWHAWSKGPAKKYNRRFSTQAEAFRWASTVTEAYRLGKQDDLRELYRKKYPHLYMKALFA